MSDINNPYKATTVTSDAIVQDTVTVAVSAKTIEAFGLASPWVKFLAVLGYIGCGIVALVGLVLMLGGGSGLFPMFADNRVLITLLGLLYVGLGVVFFFPAKFAYSLGVHLKRFKMQTDAASLESIAGWLKTIVKFYGITVIVLMGVYIIAIIVTVVFSVTTALSYYGG